eukprot:CAMPEP_0170143142 /NCGR_PEP_ID=MMETSP0033_2-20121228/9444_1 /TAXON_ID=195969 /ORGANISM="Dolichomastix tenuilepis, Strain CCMP3274" /LENGTH=783 /DNA_ID=CAMNT_0010379569 /DNA_START=17 /DNA_END=2368 /DNA_ORIENTATION=-
MKRLFVMLLLILVVVFVGPRAEAFPLLVDGQGNITIRSMSALSMQSTHPIELHTKVHAREGLHVPASSAITFGSENRTSENRLEDREGDAIRLVGHGSATIQTGQTYVETRDGAIHIVVNKTEVAKATVSSFDVGVLKVTGRVILPGESRVEADDLTIAASAQAAVVVNDPGGSSSLILSSSSALVTANLVVDGNAGMGTLYPESQLHVEGQTQLDGNVYAAYEGGRLGVGTKSPEKKLHVEGDAKLSGALHVAYAGGRLGVGTEDPETKLHVEGNAIFSNFVDVRGNSRFGNYLRIGDEGDDYNYASLILQNASQTVRWELAHSKRDDSTHEGFILHHFREGIGWTDPLTITHNDRIGIGTRDPGAAKLHVEKDGRWTWPEYAGEGHPFILWDRSKVDAPGRGEGQQLYMGADSTDSVSYIQSTGDSAMRPLVLNARGGAVGINKPDPEVSLHVSGRAYVDVQGGFPVQIKNGAPGANEAASILLQVAGPSGGNPYITFDSLHEFGWSLGMDNVDNKFKISNHFNGIDTQQGTILTIDTDKVGIGTSDPVETLHVNGDSRLHGDVEIIGSTNIDGSIELRNLNSGPFIDLKVHEGVDFDWRVMNVKSDNSLRIQNLAGNSTLRMTSDGKLGVGSPDPQATLHVAGDVQVEGKLAMDAGAGGIQKECFGKSFTGTTNNLISISIPTFRCAYVKLTVTGDWGCHGGSLYLVEYKITHDTATVLTEHSDNPLGGCAETLTTEQLTSHATLSGNVWEIFVNVPTGNFVGNPLVCFEVWGQYSAITH